MSLWFVSEFGFNDSGWPTATLIRGLWRKQTTTLTRSGGICVWWLYPDGTKFPHSDAVEAAYKIHVDEEADAKNWQDVKNLPKARIAK